jgi:hypothetical protein
VNNRRRGQAFLPKNFPDPDFTGLPAGNLLNQDPLIEQNEGWNACSFSPWADTIGWVAYNNVFG